MLISSIFLTILEAQWGAGREVILDLLSTIPRIQYVVNVQIPVGLLPVEIVFFQGIMRKVFHKPTHGRFWYSKIYSGGNRRQPVGFQGSISVLPTMGKKSNLVPIKAKTETVSC